LQPIYWPMEELRTAFARGELSPAELLEDALAQLAKQNPRLNAFVCRLEDLAGTQAISAAQSYRAGTAGPLAGIPISIKDTFDVAGAVSTRGSLVYRAHVAHADSGVVRRLRGAGAVFVGKTNTAEFGQSATTENRLGGDCRNPWDLRRTPGGSSGGAAASVAAGIVSAALGADGGGSIRIPAAFTGLVGVKPTYGVCHDEDGFPAMSEFCCPGPLAWRVADARIMLSVLSERPVSRSRVKRTLRVAWCARPEGRPIDPIVAALVQGAVRELGALGHDVEEMDIPIAGWKEAFGPIVLEEEGRLRGNLLCECPDMLTSYELASLQAAASLEPSSVAVARERCDALRARMDAFLKLHDVIVTPTTAVPAFPIGERPRTIAGEPVEALWGAFPFTAPFNVAGTPAASIPCGFVDGLPVGVQLVCARGRDALLLDLAEDLEESLNVDVISAMQTRVGSERAAQVVT
jgi:Asp-tRNA(Asn)/Glu-tRNA(Gln) amidotransferase A subunit family amidase